ncbi:uncharacterized protein AB9W97_001896 [Spinachia spinachia]
MQTPWLVALLSISMSLVVLGVVLRRQPAVTRLYKEIQTMESVNLNDQLSKLDGNKVQLENLLIKGNKIAEEEEKNVAEANADLKRRDTEMATCEAEKKTKAEELAAKEKEHIETEANLKSEYDAWTQEIENLKAQTTGYRPICDFVKDDPAVKKMCGTKPETLA